MKDCKKLSIILWQINFFMVGVYNYYTIRMDYKHIKV